MGFLHTDTKSESSAYHIDARSKLFLTFIYSVCLFFYDTWIQIGIAALLFVLIVFVSKISLKKVFDSAFVIYFLIAITLFCNSFVFSEGVMQFSLDGFTRGLFFAARIALLAWMSIALCLSTTTEEINSAIASILSPLRIFRVPVDDIATTFTIAIRFLPQTVEEFNQLRDAQWARGAHFYGGSIFKRMAAHIAIIVPLIINLFRRSEILAVSMDSRCYGITPGKRSFLEKPEFSASDIVLCCSVGLLLVLLAVVL